MALNVMKLCRIRALLTRSKITPEIRYPRLVALYYVTYYTLHFVTQYMHQLPV